MNNGLNKHIAEVKARENCQKEEGKGGRWEGGRWEECCLEITQSLAGGYLCEVHRVCTGGAGCVMTATSLCGGGGAL